MVEEGGQTSISARIAALKLDQVERQHTGPPPLYKANSGVPVLPGKRPELHVRQQSTNVPPLHNHVSAASNKIGNQPAVRGNGVLTIRPEAPPTPSLPPRPASQNVPALPIRRPSTQTPQLPPRRPSETPSEPSEYDMNRRLSTTSTSSALSTRTSMSATSTRTGASSRIESSGQMNKVRPPAFDSSTLPPLPPKRDKRATDVRALLKSSSSTPNVTAGVRSAPIAPPPQLPARPQPPPRSVAPVPKATPDRAKRSALEMGFGNKPVESLAPLDSRPNSTLASQGAPPPIPKSSRPDLSQLIASKPKTKPAGMVSGQIARTQAANATQLNGDRASCLKCRDFSAVDAHATRFPRESIPSQDLSWLAHQLTSPFTSRTDKARVIFTWLHHNIIYDTVALYTNNVKPSTPASTLSTGLAVCEGYSGLFTALGAKVGLETIVVGGHGKGLGYSQPAADSSLPPFEAGHAWNAVRIDNDEWKLIDCCWGAGSVNGHGQPYNQAFNPVHFTRDNNDFGLSHYPSNPAHFFRMDGRQSISWEEYLLGRNNGDPGPIMFSGYIGEEGIAVESFQPIVRQLRVNDPSPSIRFQFNKVCQHWDNERDGKGKHYVYTLFIGGVDGREDKRIPFETNGYFWWVDVSPRELGAPGGIVSINATTSFEGRDGRGVGVQEVRNKDGRVAMGWGGVARWELI